MASAYDVLIVDDDPIQANLLQDVLAGLGFSARVVLDGSRALEEARQGMPRLVILDLIMPGLDGLSLCMQLGPIAKAWGGRVAIASGKSGSKEAPRALKAGAQAFLQKPFTLAMLQMELGKLLGPPKSAAAPARAGLAVRVWGGRGSGPGAAGASAYGALGPCVSLGLSTGEVCILDAGTGIRACSEALARAASVKAATLLLTHYHPNHVEGLRSLGLLAKPGFSLRVMGPADPEVDLARFCQGLGAQASVSPFLLAEKEYRLGDRLQLSVSYMNHPSTTLGFSLRAGGRKVVYCPDVELAADAQADTGNNLERLRQFALGADLLLFDSHFAPEDAAAGLDEGHSSWRSAVRLALAAGARRLLLFHVSARYPDAKVAEFEAAARSAAREAGSALVCDAAKDGLVVSF